MNEAGLCEFGLIPLSTVFQLNHSISVNINHNAHRCTFCISGSSDAQPYTLKVSKALAMTGVELLLQPSLTQEAKRDLLADVQSS